MISFKGEFSIALDKHRWDFSSDTLKCITGVPPLNPSFGMGISRSCSNHFLDTNQDPKIIINILITIPCHVLFCQVPVSAQGRLARRLDQRHLPNSRSLHGRVPACGRWARASHPVVDPAGSPSCRGWPSRMKKWTWEEDFLEMMCFYEIDPCWKVL